MPDSITTLAEREHGSLVRPYLTKKSAQDLEDGHAGACVVHSGRGKDGFDNTNGVTVAGKKDTMNEAGDRDVDPRGGRWCNCGRNNGVMWLRLGCLF